MRSDTLPVAGPGWVSTTGSRSTRPSTKPRRVASAISSSAIALCVPYEVCGVRATASSTVSGSAPPNAEIELGNSSRGGAGWRRQRSSSPISDITLVSTPRS
jgi:hypothetical protein